MSELIDNIMEKFEAMTDEEIEEFQKEQRERFDNCEPPHPEESEWIVIGGANSIKEFKDFYP